MCGVAIVNTSEQNHSSSKRQAQGQVLLLWQLSLPYIYTTRMVIHPLGTKLKAAFLDEGDGSSAERCVDGNIPTV